MCGATIWRVGEGKQCKMEELKRYDTLVCCTNEFMFESIDLAVQSYCVDHVGCVAEACVYCVVWMQPRRHNQKLHLHH